jgi:hypothetical protein
MEKHDFSRVELMSDAELVRWSFVLAHMAGIEERLATLEAGLVSGRRPPDGAIAAAQEATRAELDKRTAAKGGRQP